MSLNESGDATFHRILNSMTGLYVNGTKIVGGQQPAISNATAELQSIADSVNKILDAMRGHGLIATA